MINLRDNCTEIILNSNIYISLFPNILLKNSLNEYISNKYLFII